MRLSSGSKNAIEHTPTIAEGNIPFDVYTQLEVNSGFLVPFVSSAVTLCLLLPVRYLVLRTSSRADTRLTVDALLQGGRYGVGVRSVGGAMTLKPLFPLPIRSSRKFLEQTLRPRVQIQT